MAWCADAHRAFGATWINIAILEHKIMNNVNYITCKVHENGLEIVKDENSRCRIKSAIANSTRGKISGFSAKSAKRLRRLLLDIDFSQSWAICLTLPKIKEGQEVDFAELWHGFTIASSRKLRNAFIWRVELQQRKVPHWHVVWCGDYQSALSFKYLWHDYISKRFVCSLPFFLHSVMVQQVYSGSSALMYLTAHLSKHKSTQLGWKGRQWGVVNRSLLSLRPPCSSFYVPVEVWRDIVRQFRRLSERLKIDGVYSGAYTHFHFSRSVFRRLPADYKKDFKAVKSSFGSLLRRCVFGKDDLRLRQIYGYYGTLGLIKKNVIYPIDAQSKKML